MLKLKAIAGAGLLASSLLLAACATGVGNVDGTAPAFPDMASASRPEGIYANRENLAQIVPGVSKKQILDLIGAPHFSEGMFDVSQWNYIIKFHQGKGAADKVCQLQVRFDEDDLANQVDFKPRDCLNPPVAQRTEPASVAAVPARDEVVSLSADAAFAFGSAELQPAGREAIGRLVQRLDKARLDGMRVRGYSDRIGNPRRNQQLSQARAEAVSGYLVELGVPASKITAEGLGSAESQAACPGERARALVDCLAPYRKTTISVLAH